MKKLIILAALLALFVIPVRASVTVNLDAGELTGPSTNLSVNMVSNNTFPSSNGSLLLLVDLGSSQAINHTITAGNFVGGTNFILAAGGFNTNGGTDETLTTFTTSTGTVGDDLALFWFPQLTYAQYQANATTVGGNYFGAYTPSPLGSTPDGNSAWTLPSSGSRISLSFYTSNSDGGGSQAPSAGYANYQVSAAPEPSTYLLLALGLLMVVGVTRYKRKITG